MHLSLKSYQEIIDNLRDGLYIVDMQRRIVYWNQAAERISGFRQEEVVGSCCSDNILCHVDDTGTNLCCNCCPLAATIEQGTCHDDQVFLRHKNGHRVPVQVHITALKDEEGNVIGGVETFADVSARNANEQRLKELEKLALLDRLTQIANRHYLERELEARREELNRYGVPFGLLFMDIDDFKHVNDHYGHETGDRVLQFVAGTLSSNSRTFDLYGRWGGEEFIGITRNVTTVDLQKMGQRLRRLVEKSYLMINGEKLSVTISLGGTMATTADTMASLIQRADAAMYQSKAAGKNRLTMG